MSTELVLLGTAGGPMPAVSRSAPAQALVVDGSIYLIDCGNGVARQMRLAGLDLAALKGVFLTHHHSDHSADLGTLFLVGWGGLTNPVDVLGPPPLGALLDSWFVAFDYDITTRTHDDGRPALHDFVHEREVTGAGEVFRDGNVTVTAAVVEHPPVTPSFAYRFDTPDGSVVVSGDTSPCRSLIELADGVDVLVHEVIDPAAVSELPDSATRDKDFLRHLLEAHTSVDQVGTIAQEAGVGTLVLSHLVPADGTPDEVWGAKAQQHFTGAVIVGRDLSRIRIGEARDAVG